MTTQFDRAHGALAGLAIGDALGMPTQSMSRGQIAEVYGSIDRLRDAAPEQQIARGMHAGEITDDTEQALLVARLLVDGAATIDGERLANELLSWERAMSARGSLDLLGPSSKAAIEAIASGASIEDAGKTGSTNGAAMRIAPAGIARSIGADGGPALLDLVQSISRITHNTGLAISGAALVAGTVSAGIDGANANDALEAGIDLGLQGETRGNWVAGASIPARVTFLRPAMRSLAEHDFLDAVERVVGTSVASQESVVAAALITDRYTDDPWRAVLASAELGGDTDTVGAMVGAMLGAIHGVEAFPSDVLDQIERRSQLRLAELVSPLLALRTA